MRRTCHLDLFAWNRTQLPNTCTQAAWISAEKKKGEEEETKEEEEESEEECTRCWQPTRLNERKRWKAKTSVGPGPKMESSAGVQ